MDEILGQEEFDLFSEPTKYEAGSSSCCVEEKSGKISDATCSEGSQNEEMRSSKQRLVLVANRLPFKAIKEKETNEWKMNVSSGGLASACSGLKGFEIIHIGSAGMIVDDEVEKESLTKALAKKHCVPVFFDKETFDLYYNGYCNKILWPLLHYLGLPQDHLLTSQGIQSQFDMYKKANQIFADVVCKFYQPGDIVWCHDYHLMFLPEYLKRINNKMTVGWFLHTPFPSSEIHRTLPTRSELLRSILFADIVGFHTYDYARHFVSACTRLLGLEGTPEGVEGHGKLTKVSTFPIGINPEHFFKALELPEVKTHMDIIRSKYNGKKIILGVDRLDMIKGIPQKLLAYEKFLEDNAKWHDKVTLIQIAVPSRIDVPEYQNLKRTVHEIVGRINGKYGTVTSVAMHHLDRSLDFHELCALYAVADIALVTSLRDGMNLVSFEFVACQASNKGVLILSEFAGAAQSLGAGAILVNPWNISQVASSIAKALEMADKDREERHDLNFKQVTTRTAQEWADVFVSELKEAVAETQKRKELALSQPSLSVDLAVRQYVQSNYRLLILGFNATLTKDEKPIIQDDQIINVGPKLHPALYEPLKKICSDPQTTVIVISGSEKEVLDEQFGDYNIWLAAENGVFLRHTKGEWMMIPPEFPALEWVDKIKHVFEYFTKRTHHSFLEERQTSLRWNCKHADPIFARLQARDMLLHLWTGPVCNSAVDVYKGKQSVEVRAVGVTKGAAMDRILAEIALNRELDAPFDYVLCIGHFLGKDEDIYSFFETETRVKRSKISRTKSMDTDKTLSPCKNNSLKSSLEADGTGTHRRVANLVMSSTVENTLTGEGATVLDLKREKYFSCAVNRKHTSARYTLEKTEEVVLLLKKLAEVSKSSSQ